MILFKFIFVFAKFLLWFVLCLVLWPEFQSLDKHESHKCIAYDLHQQFVHFFLKTIFWKHLKINLKFVSKSFFPVNLWTLKWLQKIKFTAVSVYFHNNMEKQSAATRETEKGALEINIKIVYFIASQHFGYLHKFFLFISTFISAKNSDEPSERASESCMAICTI